MQVLITFCINYCLGSVSTFRSPFTFCLKKPFNSKEEQSSGCKTTVDLTMHFHPLPKADYSSQRHFRHMQIIIITWEVILIDLMKSYQIDLKVSSQSRWAICWQGFMTRTKWETEKELLVFCRLPTPLHSPSNLVDFAGAMAPWERVCGISYWNSCVCLQQVIYGSSSKHRDSAGGISEALCSVTRHPTEEKKKACLNWKARGIHEQRAKTQAVHIIYLQVPHGLREMDNHGSY